MRFRAAYAPHQESNSSDPAGAVYDRFHDASRLPAADCDYRSGTDSAPNYKYPKSGGNGSFAACSHKTAAHRPVPGHSCSNAAPYPNPKWFAAFAALRRRAHFSGSDLHASAVFAVADHKHNEISLFG